MVLKKKPSARIHRRYLLIENSSRNEVEKIILDYIGILGWAECNPEFVNGDELILAVERKSLDKVRASFELADKKIKIRKVSGTLKGLKR